MSTPKLFGIDDLLTEHRDEILAIAQQYGATNVRVFGSVARGEATAESDIDLLIDLTRSWTLMDRIGFKQDVEALLGRPVDVVVASTLRAHVRPNALREAVSL